MVTLGDQDFTQSAIRVVNRQKRRNGVLVRRAEIVDIASLMELNTSSIRYLGRKGLFMPMPEAFFTRMVADGVAIVLEKEGRALGYSVAVPAGKCNEAFLPVTSTSRAGLLFGTALDPALRGQGWQKSLIDIRVEIFKNSGFSEVQSTVSPSNIPSLINLIDSGFQVSGLKTMLDNYPRFLVRHDIHGGEKGARNCRRKLVLTPSEGLSDHKSILNEGFVGIQVIRSRPIVIVYAKKK
ncbi:hypothetical protein [Hoeflea sp.]|uniref:hypothetical protein n=1 Tax=Hoeflea sp. TaxID=1940281 RepID=UPI003B02B8DC